MKLDVEKAEYDIATATRLDTGRQSRHVVVEFHPVPDKDFGEVVERFDQVSLAWTRWERLPKQGRAACRFAAAQGAP